MAGGDGAYVCVRADEPVALWSGPHAEKGCNAARVRGQLGVKGNGAWAGAPFVELRDIHVPGRGGLGALFWREIYTHEFFSFSEGDHGHLGIDCRRRLRNRRAACRLWVRWGRSLDVESADTGRHHHQGSAC
jgi:hypothetical protein